MEHSEGRLSGLGQFVLLTPTKRISISGSAADGVVSREAELEVEGEVGGGAGVVVMVVG